jgi:hypothetical protein
MKFGKNSGTAWGAPLALGLTMLVGAAQAASAQTPPAATPPAEQPAQQQAPPEKPTFNGASGMLLVQIKPDKTAEYEGLIAKLKETLQKSEKPERKAMANGWKVYKAAEAMGGNTLYVHIIEPAAPADYANAFRIISEVYPTEVGDIYNKVKDAYVPNGVGALNLSLLQDFSKP